MDNHFLDDLNPSVEPLPEQVNNDAGNQAPISDEANANRNECDPAAPDIDQMLSFIKFIAPDSKATFQTFGETTTHPDLTRILHGVSQDNLQILGTLNARGTGAFIVVNETDGQGRKAENITKVRFVFCDLDEDGDAKLARIQADTQRPPHAIIESSPGKYHVYWRMDGSVKLGQFSIIQKALAAKFGGDPKVSDLPRLMRIAGLLHNKGKPVMSRIIQMDDDLPAYSVSAFADELTPPQAAPANPLPKESRQTVPVVTGISEGGRNNAIFKTACQLREQGHSYEGAKRTVLEMAGKCHPPLPETEAIQCLDSAWRYGSEGEKVIAELNDKFAKVMVGGSCYIMKEDKDTKTGQVTIELCRPEDVRMWFSDRTITVSTGGREQDINIFDFWLKHPKHRRYGNIGFDPEQTLPDDVYNLYRGPGVKPNANGSCDLFLKHIENNIADGNPEIYRYILDWMADAVQKPTQRPGVALLLQGDQGVGKSIFADQFGRLFGQHYVQITSSRELTGSFNAHLEGKLLVFYDEANCLGDRQASAKLRALITERRLPIERKGRDLLYVDNYIRLILASNNNVVISAALDERRFFAIQVGNKHQGDRPYFKAILEEMDNGGREHLLDLLMTRDLSGVELCNFPKTKALLEHKLGSMEPVLKWWYEEWLMHPADQWRDVVGKEALYQNYLDYCTNTGKRHPLGKNIFGRKVKGLAPGVKDVRRTTRQQDSTLPPKAADATRERQYQFPSQQECRQFFEALIKQPIDWDADQ